ncbi:MAG: putative AraC family transcriptional regulator [Firmicutes bacterium]|nr:putative AraC family transcriptional regulator [Bacillota bacterium]
MSAWTEGLQNAIEYIEKNLAEDIQVKDIAEKAYVSEFHFQRIFSALCGFSVVEYIRNRRLALAARELAGNDVKVIDVAIKYGYDSPDSFARAFTRFHGITPSAAKEKGALLRDFAPLRIILSLEGGTMMDYRIEEKAAFTVMGRKRSFNNETAYQEIPKFWKEHMQDGGSEIVCGMFGLCIDSNGSNFDYLIADNYLPWKDIPDGYETRTLSAGTWAVFPCKLKNLQDTNTKMWKEWLPNCKDYKLVGNYNIEMYAPPCEEDIAESYCEIWLPIEKA